MSKTPKQNQEVIKRLRRAILSAARWRLLLAIVVVSSLQILTVLRRIRPVDLLLPVMASQMLILVMAIFSRQPFSFIAIGNIILAGAAMFPSTLQNHKRR